jgi:hypothetical protein
MATKDDVRTTRLMPASQAARRTRSVPSRVGMIKSFSCFGALGGNGEATCRAYAQSLTASAQLSSLVRSASAKDS